MTFYLGTHEAHWLGKREFADVPLFVSHTRLRKRRRLPRAVGPWCLDSGGFTQVTKHGRFQDRPRRYAAKVRRYSDEIGNLSWASIQDWMCEEVALSRTGLTVDDHIARTVQSALDLTDIAPDLPWRYNLQGFACDDYLRCLEAYERSGIETRGRTFGLGSVCRRQSTTEAQAIVERLEAEGVKLHLYGYKLSGVELVASLPHVVSSDSMAWSYAGRREGHCALTGNASCNHCVHYALSYYNRVQSRINAASETPRQMRMFYD